MPSGDDETILKSTETPVPFSVDPSLVLSMNANTSRVLFSGNKVSSIGVSLTVWVVEASISVPSNETVHCPVGKAISKPPISLTLAVHVTSVVLFSAMTVRGSHPTKPSL